MEELLEELLDSRNVSSTASLNIKEGSSLNPNMPAKDNTNTNNIVKVEDTKKGEDTQMIVPFYKLFIFADTLDIVLMSIATITSMANGLSFPIMVVFFGSLTNAFEQNQGTDNTRVVHEVSKVKHISPK